MNINNFILNKSAIENDNDFNVFAEWFNSSNELDARLAAYKEYKEKNNLEDEATAKIEILSNLFGEYINRQMLEAQNLCGIGEDNDTDNDVGVEAANEIINNIKKIKFVFKDYDKLTFKDYLHDVVDGINYDELNAIFEKEIFTQNDVSIIAKTINSTLSKKVHNEYNSYSKSFINHELCSLFSLSRKKLSVFNEENFDKYRTLAKALIEYNKNEQKEGFDGAIAFLIDLDIKQGLFNIDESYDKTLFDVMNKIKNNDFNKYDINRLMKIAVEKSKNFEDDGFGNIKTITNSGESLRLKGVSDRCFDSTLVHSVSKPERESNQVGRAAQLKISNANKNNNTNMVTSDFPVSIQIGTRPAISRQLLEFVQPKEDKTQKKIPVSSREQLILSYANNFSYYLQLISDGEVSVDILNHGPIELYTSTINQSKRFMNDFINLEDKINTFVQAYTNVLNETNILNIPNSTFSEDKKHIHVLKPLKLIFDSMLQLYENEPDKYGQTFSNFCHLLLNNKDVLLTGNKEFASDFKSRFRIINGLKDELLSAIVVETPLLKNTSLDLDDDLSFCDVIKEKLDKPKELYEYIEGNLDSMTFDKLSADEIDALKAIPEDTKKELMPLFNLLARDAFEALTNTGSIGRPLEMDIAIPVINKLTSYDKDKRVFIGKKESYNMETSSERKIFSMFYSENFSDNTKQQLEVFALLAHITDGKISGPKNTYRTNYVLNKRLGL